MDRYQKVEKPKPESPINENEIRITTQGAIRNYISYATTLLQEKRAREIVLKAMGQAISKTVAIGEILKKRIPRLHQDTAISSVSITDVWEPIEEGLVPVEMTRHVSMISLTLSFRELNQNSPGYQTPYNVEQVKPQSNYQQQQPKQGRGPYNAVNEDSYGRGRGQGRGRGRGRGRNWGRAGYGNYQGEYGNYQGRYDNYQGGYGNNQGGYGDNQGGYGNNQGGYGNNQGGYGNYKGGYGNNQGGYGNNQGGYGNKQGGYGNNQGGYDNNQGGYDNYHDNGGYLNRGRGGGRGRGWGYRSTGYERGRGGGRGYVRGRGRGRMGGRSSGVSNQA